MADFTLKIYRKYLTSIQKKHTTITFDEYFKHRNGPPERFCILRHDVDRRPENALVMARLEAAMGIRATYYFRTRAHVMVRSIISEIQNMGHEIGFHYESFSDARGDLQKATLNFKQQLNRLRRLAPVSTIAMHGRPFSPHDNRDMWRSPQQRQLLSDMGITGDVYLDIDYSDIAYISDTGRNWSASESNIRDKVDSDRTPKIKSGQSLLPYLEKTPHHRLVLLTHPERWSDNFLNFTTQLLKDRIVNIIKKAL